MRSTKLGLGVVMLLLFLIGCGQPRANVGMNVTNLQEKTLCLGGLKAKGSYPGTIIETGKVLPGTIDNVDFLTPESAGTSITVEAWCYGVNGEEVGYTKVAGSYRYRPLLGVSINPPLQGEPLPVDCNVPTEQRGEEICLQVSFIEGA